MPPKKNSFTAKYDRKTNVLFTDVLISIAFDPTITPKAQYPPPRKYMAIWDTGATNTVVSPRVVTECGLSPTGMVNMLGSTGAALSNTYLVNIELPNKAGIYNVKVTGSPHPIGKFDLLIGMDIIGMGDFAVTHHDGKTTFSYRSPSHQCIDFVKDDTQPPAKQPIKHTGLKVGRNERCPCGSGKKYKNCHGSGLR